jgi:5-(hydroxymethyl)furfural/furfural oxidase
VGRRRRRAQHRRCCRGGDAGVLTGRLRLRSPSPLKDPVVEFGTLSDERDLIRLRDAIRRLISLLSHPAVTEIATAATFEGPLDRLGSDDAIDEYLMATGSDCVHAVGTCRMGSLGDPAAVVDTTCSVIGYENLRVCDASVMPDLPKANAHLTTVAIAERLSTILTTT